MTTRIGAFARRGHRLMVLRALGLPLERIRELLQHEPSPELMRRLLDERKAVLARRIDSEKAPSDQDAFAPACAAVRKTVSRQPFELEWPMRERYLSSADDRRFDLTEIQFSLRPS